MSRSIFAESLTISTRHVAPLFQPGAHIFNLRMVRLKLNSLDKICFGVSYITQAKIGVAPVTERLGKLRAELDGLRVVVDGREKFVFGKIGPAPVIVSIGVLVVHLERFSVVSDSAIIIASGKASLGTVVIGIRVLWVKGRVDHSCLCF